MEKNCQNLTRDGIIHGKVVHTTILVVREWQILSHTHTHMLTEMEKKIRSWKKKKGKVPI